MVKNETPNVVIVAASMLVIAALLYIIQVLYVPIIKPIFEVLLPFLAALAIALMLDPVIDRLSKRGMSRGLAVALVGTTFLGAILIAAIFLIPALVHQGQDLYKNGPEYLSQADVYINKQMVTHKSLLERFHLPINTKGLANSLSSKLPAAASSLENVPKYLGGFVSGAVILILIPIITVFLLMDIDKLKKKALLFVPKAYRDKTALLVGAMGKVFGSYIRGLITVSILYGIACGLFIAVRGIPYAVMLGTIAGVLSLVPYIGTISTLIIVGIVTLVQQPGHPMNALWMVLGLLVINQLFDNLVSPKVVGKAVGIHPALAIFALLLGAQLFGILGMILSVPVAASLQLLAMEYYPELKIEEEKKAKRSPVQSIKHKFSKKAK